MIWNARRIFSQRGPTVQRQYQKHARHSTVDKKRLKKCHSRILKSFSRLTIIFVKAQEVGVFPLCAKSFLWVSFPSVVLKRKDINIFLSILYPLPKNLRAKIHFCVHGKMLPNRKRRSKTNDLLILLSLLQLLMSRNSWFQRTIFDH